MVKPIQLSADEYQAGRFTIVRRTGEIPRPDAVWAVLGSDGQIYFEARTKTECLNAAKKIMKNELDSLSR